MNKVNVLNSLRTYALALLFALTVSTDLVAATFSYVNGNVLLCFRRTGGASDLIANVGTISFYTNLAPNTKVAVTGYTGQQLGYVGTNNLLFTALAFYPSSSVIFMSNPRPDLADQSTPYYSDTVSAQGQIISKLTAIVNGAVNNGNFSSTNTATAVLESDSYQLGVSAASYQAALGPNQDFGGTFQADPETSTPPNFTTSATAVRADFYWMQPTANVQFPPPDAAYLGYFELNTNGVMTYTAYPSATLVAPVITSFLRQGTTNKVTFTTGSIGTYTLRGTNSAGLTAPRLTWPAVSSVPGDGGSHTLTESNNVANKFYIITAQ